MGCGCVRVCVVGGGVFWHGIVVISLLDSTSCRYTHIHTHTQQALEYHYGKSCSEQAPDTSGPLFEYRRTHTHTHSLQTQTQAFHIGNIITAITSDSNITLHLGLSLSLSRCVSASYSISPLFLLTLPFLLLSTHVGVVYNHLCVCLCE